MPMHLGTTLGLIGSAVITIQDYRRGGLHECVRSWTGWDWNYPDAWFPTRIRAPIPMAIGGGVTWVAKKTGYNDDTPKGVNV